MSMSTYILSSNPRRAKQPSAFGCRFSLDGAMSVLCRSPFVLIVVVVVFVVVTVFAFYLSLNKKCVRHT